MDRKSERRSSAFYQRRHRERLRDQGLLKKELWVLPEYADDLAAIERQMRLPRGDAALTGLDDGGTTMTATAARSATRATAAAGDLAVAHAAISGGVSMRAIEPSHSHSPWTAASLYEALVASAPVREGAIALELIDGAEPGFYLIMHDYGDLPLFMAVVGQQIVVEALLWPLAQVRDVAHFNDEALRTHKLFPLSTLGIETIDGESVYIMFGALSSTSSLIDVLFEIETLADNVIRATEAYELHLREVV
jgi:uncharacterized protein